MARLEAKTEVTGAVWKIVTVVGQKLAPGETVMLIESMKMEIPVVAEDGGTLVEFHVAEGDSVEEGQLVASLSA